MNANSVLFLTYWYPNKSNKSFGIFLKRHAHAIAINNKVVVLSLTFLKSNSLYKKTVNIETDEANIETHRIYFESVFSKLLYVLLPLHYIILKKYIRTHLQKHNFNILHSNILFPCSVVGHWLSRKLHLKHIITEEWTKVDKFFRVSLYKGAGKKTLNKADAIVCVSQQLEDTVKKHTHNNKFHIIPNVIDAKEFYYDANIQKNEVFTFIAAAHWGQHKNPFYFLDALKQLLEENKIKNFKVVLAGSGVYLEKVKQNNYPFPIEYPGNLNSRELCTALNKSHIFLHGSEFETFSVIIAEALMCGLPSVVSPVGIALEAINTSNGFVTNNTVPDWKEKILACYNTSYNNAHIAEQLKNKYDLKTVGKMFDEMYRTA